MTKPKRDRKQRNKPRSTPFNTVLIEALNDRLKAILGEPAATLLLHHLEKNSSLKMEEIPEKPASFAAALENVMGKDSASIIETSIIEELYTKLGLKHQRIKDYSFADYVRHARKKQR